MDFCSNHKKELLGTTDQAPQTTASPLGSGVSISRSPQTIARALDCQDVAARFLLGHRPEGTGATSAIPSSDSQLLSTHSDRRAVLQLCHPTGPPAKSGAHARQDHHRHWGWTPGRGTGRLACVTLLPGLPCDQWQGPTKQGKRTCGV